MEYNAETKMDMILWSPVAVFTLIFSYGVTKFISHSDVDTGAASGSHAAHRLHSIRMTCEKMAVAALMILSSFYLKGVLGGFDCTMSNDGNKYLDIQPAVQCDSSIRDVVVGEGEMATKLPDYANIRDKAVFGVVAYACVILAFIRFFLTPDGRIRYLFLTNKMEDKWYLLCYKSL